MACEEAESQKREEEAHEDAAKTYWEAEGRIKSALKAYDAARKNYIIALITCYDADMRLNPGELSEKKPMSRKSVLKSCALPKRQVN